MPSNEGIFFAIMAALVVMLAIIILSKPLVLLLGFTAKAVVGAAMIFAANFLLKPIGVYIGLNCLTVFVTAFLGIPGMVLLALIGKI